MWEESDMHEAKAPRVMAGKWPTGRMRVLGKGGFQVEPATLLRCSLSSSRRPNIPSACFSGARTPGSQQIKSCGEIKYIKKAIARPCQCKCCRVVDSFRPLWLNYVRCFEWKRRGSALCSCSLQLAVMRVVPPIIYGTDIVVAV